MSSQPAAIIQVIDGQLVQSQAYQHALADLRSQASAIVKVLDQSSYTEAMELSRKANDIIKTIEAHAEPERIALRQRLNELLAQRDKFISEFTDIVEPLKKSAKEWSLAERRKAEEEQRRENEERKIAAQRQAEEERKERERQAEITRKAREKEIEEQRRAGELTKREVEKAKKLETEIAEREKARAAEDAKQAAQNVQTVTVKPNIPVVPGTKNQQYWKFRIVNAHLIPATFRMPDEVAIGRMVRDTKDKAKAEAQCPGIEVWTE